MPLTLVLTGCNLYAFKIDRSPKNVIFIFTNVAVMEIVTIIDANVTLDGVKILIAVVQVQVSYVHHLYDIDITNIFLQKQSLV